MSIPPALYQSSLSSLRLRSRGKVRDIYDIDEKHMLIVTTDRLSAFDVILPDPIPGKGRVLTRVSNFWFEKMKHILPNHLVDIPLEQVVPDAAEREQVEGRTIVVKVLKPLPVEAIVRGYLIGSGWKDYQKTGCVCGIRLPEGLQQAPITNVRRVIITLGRQPAAALRGETLLVQVAPEMGYAGRPSSNAIRNVVTGAVQGPEN